LAREINALFPDHIRFSRLQTIAEQITPKTLQHTLHQATQTSVHVDVQSPHVGAYSIIELN
jgi:DNA-binding HxlR family transcriptional regulator